METSANNSLTLETIHYMKVKFARMKFREVENDDLYDRLILINIEGEDIKPTREDFNSNLLSVKLEQLRTKRNTILEQSDRYAINDYPHSNLAVQQEWLDYRQALRDLPSVTEDPANPVWPTAPTS